MAPTIAVDSKTGRPVLSIGGAGGTRITSGILQGKNQIFSSWLEVKVFWFIEVILNKLKFKMNNNEAVQFNRIHHQLSPNRLEYQGMTHVLWLIHWKLGL